MSAFEELGVCPELIRACDEQGWALPTPVQAEAVPLILGGGDVMVGACEHRTAEAHLLRVWGSHSSLTRPPRAAAETGSGKTAAFALPVLQIVHEAIREEMCERSAGTPASAPAAPTDVRMSGEDRDALMAIAPNGLLCQVRAAVGLGCRASCAAQLSTRGQAAGRTTHSSTPSRRSCDLCAKLLSRCTDSTVKAFTSTAVCGSVSSLIHSAPLSMALHAAAAHTAKAEDAEDQSLRRARCLAVACLLLADRPRRPDVNNVTTW